MLAEFSGKGELYGLHDPTQKDQQVCPRVVGYADKKVADE